MLVAAIHQAEARRVLDTTSLARVLAASTITTEMRQATVLRNAKHEQLYVC